VSVAVKHLKSSESFFQHADQPMPSASLIKVAVMVEVYHQAQSGKLKLSDQVTFHNADNVPGRGILTPHFSDGTQISVADAVRLMIAFSDNTATNLVLEKIGLEATSRDLNAPGYPQTKLNSTVFQPATASDPERCQQFGLGSTTARETVPLFEQLYRGQVVTKEAPAEMLQHLKKCDDKDKFPRLLPEGTMVAHKVGTGQRLAVRTDGGILFTPSGPIALSVLTAKNEDTSLSPENAGNQLCATVAREVFNHFNLAASSAVE
jgi:beta-lactamase class A